MTAIKNAHKGVCTNSSVVFSATFKKNKCCLLDEQQHIGQTSNPLVSFSPFSPFLCVRSSKQTNLCVRKTLSLHTMRGRELNVQTTQKKAVQRVIIVYGESERVVSARLSVLPLTLHSLGQSFSRKTDR